LAGLKEKIMRLNPPKTITWIIAVIVGILGIIGSLAGFFGGFAFWLVVIGFVLLALATLLKGL
jgi:fatty acid desaturase